MKIYIATPVNGRNEKTLLEKRQAAFERVKKIAEYLKGRYPDAECHSSFDEHIAPLRGALVWREATIMGACVQEVMDCDAIILDEGWESSKGCQVEHHVARVYGKKVGFYTDWEK